MERRVNHVEPAAGLGSEVLGPKSWETGCCQAHPLPQANRPRTDSRRAPGANPAASGVHFFPIPSGWAEPLRQPKRRRLQQGQDAAGRHLGIFSQSSTGFAIALLRIMAEAGNPNSPTGLRGGGFILQRRTHSDRPGISGGEGMRSFRTPECGKNKTLPTQARYHLTWGREFRATKLQTSAFLRVLSARTGIAFPSTGEKQDLKTLHYCGSLSKPINVRQAAAANGGSEMGERGEGGWE